MSESATQGDHNYSLSSNEFYQTFKCTQPSKVSVAKIRYTSDNHSLTI